MENTVENRAKFFALHYGQEVMNSDSDGWGIRPVDHNNIYPIDEHDYLLLKTLSSITDEDAIELARIEGYNPSGVVRRLYNYNLCLEILMEENEYQPIASLKISNNYLIFWDNNDVYEDSAQKGVTTAAYDFVRSKGYALPYFGLSVNDLVQRGWIKLKH